jgi:hypothetical protein
VAFAIGPATAPIAVSADGEVDDGAPALAVSTPAAVGAEPAAVEMPAEGAVSRGGEAIVLVWLEVVPCGEVADDGRVPMSAAVKEPSTAVSKMSFAAVVAARISVVEITGWVTVETEVITGWVTSVAVATTGCTAATTGWVTSVAVATTGCTAATTGWVT